MGALNEQLAEIKATGNASKPPEVVEAMARGVEAVRASGILAGVAGVGTAAPLFARPAIDGTTLRLKTLIKRGPVILSFFRGRW